MQVIDANPANAKALYRRGMAYMTLGDFEEARNDFEMVNFLMSNVRIWMFWIFYTHF